MKRTQRIRITLQTAATATALLAVLSACSTQLPTGAEVAEQQPAVTLELAAPAPYTKTASRVFKFVSGSKRYQGGSLQIQGGAHFSVAPGAIMPPEGFSASADMTITMQMDKGKVGSNEMLVFTFGPHGTKFDPPAQVTFDWSDLNLNIAAVYYIEDDGSLTPQQPTQIDVSNKKVTIDVHHFSRYAIGTEGLRWDEGDRLKLE